MLTLLVAASLAQVVSPENPTTQTRLEAAQLPGIGEVWLELRSFEVLDRDFRMEIGGAMAADTALAASVEEAARAVTTWSGEVVGFDRSHAYVAESPRGRLGLIEIAGKRFALAPETGSWAGPIRGATRWIESPGAGAPAVDEMCRMLAPGQGAQGAQRPEAPTEGAGILPLSGCCGHAGHGHGSHAESGRGGAEGGIAGEVTPRDPVPLARGIRVRMAADADYEFTSIFADPADCSAYLVSLYGAISALYEREMSVRMQLSYARLWTTPDDPFTDFDPLGQFRDHWNKTQGDVVRDLAQLVTGRRDLPYGGVAWLQAACEDYGYSVSGYMIGSFADPGRTDPGNWDIIVAAHEIGHNVGTWHTHDYGIDECAFGAILRGSIMSYCHTVSGATSNIDLTLHRILRGEIASFLLEAPCLGRDCDGDGIEDSEAISKAIVADRNGDGVPDPCQDCDEDGTLDPEEIAAGAVDLDEDGVPDACQPDCNGNGVVDTLDVISGSSDDQWGNMVPDECEVDCNGNGVSDYNEIIADMSLDVDRDARLDACQDCDGDGTIDAEVLGSSRHWWVSSTDDAMLRELHPRSGVRVRSSDASPAPAYALALSADGFVLGTTEDSVGRWDAQSGDYLGSLVAAGAGGLSQARDLLVMDDGSLVVASRGSAAVLKFTSGGASDGTFVQFTGTPPPQPTGLALRSDEVIAVSTDDGLVRGYEWPSGAPAGVLADLNAIGKDSKPTGILFLPDGDLLVASRGFSAIHRFDGETGAHLGRFDIGPPPSSAIAMVSPNAMRLFADGKVVLVTDDENGAPIVGLDVESGRHLRTYRVYGTDAPSATGLLVMPASPLDCNGNLLPDSCDILSGTSLDENRDGVPDECQGGPWAAGDLNGDGAVDGNDLAILLGAWGECVSPTCIGDINDDGTVDGNDLAILLGAWTG